MKNTALIQFISITLYRLDKCMEGSDVSFLSFKAGNDCRTPAEILNHLNQVANYALSIARADPVQLTEENSHKKFISIYNSLFNYLKKTEISENQLYQLINGPLSDALTHVGQLAMLRRLANDPIEWENYAAASPNAKSK